MSAITRLRQLVNRKATGRTPPHALLQGISESVFLTSPYLAEPNFRTIHPDDLQLLYELYDETFFDGLLRKCLSPSDISFRLSGRMTRAGGKTTRFRSRTAPQQSRFEIAVSTTLLFGSFRDPERSVTVTGLECESRLDGLMRVMEHEIVHLIEMLIWDDSSCSKARFQNIAAGFFGHSDYRHDLITPTETAVTQYGIRPGTRVRFDLEGHTYEGVVNRITKRATVLVPHPKGQPFSDGIRYFRFYVPVQLLEPIES